METPYVGNDTVPRTYRLLNRNLNVMFGISPYRFLLREIPEASKATQAVVVALVFHLNLIQKAY